MKKLLTRLWRDDEAQDLAEYALLLTLLALGAIATLRVVATTVNNVFQNAATNIGNAAGG